MTGTEIIASGTPKLKALMAAPNNAELAEAAREIEGRYKGLMVHIASTVDHAMVLGDALIRAKPLVGHGRWGLWLRENTSVSESECQRYMQLARNREVIEAKAAHVRDLTIGAALKLIAKPREESTSALAKPPSPTATRTEKKLRAALEPFHDLELPERKEFMRRVEVEAKLTPPAVGSAEYRLAKAEGTIAELEAELDAAALVEPGHAGGEHEERAAGGAELHQATAAEDDPIASRRRQLADLRAAWARADSAVRQTFVREEKLIGALEWPTDG